MGLMVRMINKASRIYFKGLTVYGIGWLVGKKRGILWEAQDSNPIAYTGSENARLEDLGK